MEGVSCSPAGYGCGGWGLGGGKGNGASKCCHGREGVTVGGFEGREKGLVSMSVSRVEESTAGARVG